MILFSSLMMNGFKGVGNVLFNGFSDIKEQDKEEQIGVQITHFYPINQWVSKRDYSALCYNYTEDQATKDKYEHSSAITIRLKCAAFFLAL